MAKQRETFTPEEFLHFYGEYAQQQVDELCELVEEETFLKANSSFTDPRYISTGIGGRRRSFRLKEKALKKKDLKKKGAQRVRAIRAIAALEMVIRGQRELSAAVAEVGDDLANRLFETAFEVGQRTTLLDLKERDYKTFVLSFEHREGARKTVEKIRSNRPDYRQEVADRMATGMRLKDARQAVVDKYDCSCRTVSDDTRWMAKEKR